MIFLLTAVAKLKHSRILIGFLIARCISIARSMAILVIHQFSPKAISSKQILVTLATIQQP